MNDTQRQGQAPLSEAEEFTLQVTGKLPERLSNSGASGMAPRQVDLVPPAKKRLTNTLIIGGVAFLALIQIALQAYHVKPFYHPNPPGIVTMAEFDQLHNGMSYAQVAQIIGDPGKVKVTGVKGFSFAIYEWRNDDNSWVTCQFQNDRLTDRTQQMLPDPQEEQ